MIASLIALLGQFWQPIAGAVLAGVGVLYAIFVKKGATADVATARQSEAEAHVKVAQMSQAQAEANAKATQTTADAAKDRTDVENQIAAAPAGQSAGILRDQWSRD